MQNLLVEVQRLKLHRVLQPWLHAVLSYKLLVTRQWPADFLRFECRLVRLQYNIVQRLHVEDAQVIVVGTGQHIPEKKSPFQRNRDKAGTGSLVISTPCALELVEYTIVLVQIT